MSNLRKLQTEIDRVMKKVDEGVDLFDEIWEKVYSAEQQNQKEKYEMDLKKEIKKLQRLRDQIKTWIGSSDVKDKDALIDARKLIETKMEQFKVCEKETKTKTYSKEGLAREEKLDPAEEARQNTIKWISESIDKFNSLVEDREVEIERLSAGRGKKTNKHTIEEYNQYVTDHKFHINKLEGIMRLVNNERLKVEDVDALKEDLDYYLEAYEDDDYQQSYDEDYFYESLGLEDLDVVNVDRVTQLAKDAKDDASATSSKADNKKKDKASKKAASSVIPLTIGRARGASTAGEKEKPTTPSKLTRTTSAPSPAAAAAAAAPAPPKAPPVAPATTPGGASMAAILKRETEQQEKERQQKALQQQQLLREQQARAQAEQQLLQQQQLQRQQQEAQLRQQELLRQQQQQQAQQKAAAAQQQQQQEALKRQQLQLQEQQARQQQQAAQQEAAAKQQQQLQAQQQAAVEQKQKLQQQQQSATGGVDILGAGLGGLSIGSAADPRRADNATATASPMPTSLSAVSSPQQQPSSFGGAAGGGDVSSSYLTALNQSFAHIPSRDDSERPKTYTARNPYPTPACYPSTPAPIFDNAAIFEKLGTDCLFFIFYYSQGTYQQYLAARELKKQSWRYHKKYMTWFQRHEEPKVTTDEYEEGTYVYFDYETGWCQRIKADFRFEYSYLEDSLS